MIHSTATLVLSLSALCSPVLAAFDVEDYYQVGMHRFAIRDGPIQRPMSAPAQTPSVVSTPVFNARFVVCRNRLSQQFQIAHKRHLHMMLDLFY